MSGDVISRRRRAGFTRIELLVVIAIIALVLLLSVGSLPLAFVIDLAVGWVRFLARSASSVTISWSGVVMLAVAGALFLMGTHALARRLVRESGTDAESRNGRWRWRWTVAGLGIVLLMFAAGIAVVGLVHQVIWLATMDEPLLENGFRRAAWRTQSRHNLQQIGLALHNYHDDSGAFPPGGTFDDVGVPQHSWQTRLLPFIDQAPLSRELDLSRPWNDPGNRPHFERSVPQYINPGFRESPTPGARGYAVSHYAANGHVVGGGFGLRLSDITDGASNTLIGGEVAARFRAWGDPLNWRDPARGINRSPDGFGGPFEGGANFLMSDGAVRFVSEDIDPAVLKAVATPAGADKVSDW